MTTFTSLLDHLYEGDIVDTSDLARVSDTNPRSVARWKAEAATPRRDAEERLLELRAVVDLARRVMRDDAARGIPENVLLEDYGKLLGGKTRLQQMLLPVLSRLGFIERRNKVLYEGSLLDLAFDYAELAPRILDGALADVLVAVNGKNEAKTASTATGDT